MARSPVRIRLDPNRCDRCGHCVRVCEPGALKVGPTYIYLDWRACDECMKCVDACERGAILRREGSRKDAGGKRGKTAGAPVRETAVPRPRPRSGDGARVVDRPAAGGLVIWTLLEAIAVLAVAFAVLLGKNALLASDVVASMPAAGRVMTRVVVLSVFYAIQFALLAGLAHRQGSTLPGAFGLIRVRASARSWLAATGWVGLLLVSTRLAAWVWGIASRAVGFDPPRIAEGGFAEVFGAGLPGLALSVILVVLVAPIAEEMVFRGVLLGALGTRWGAAVGLLGSSVLFAFYHLTPWQSVPVFILGIACGWLTQHRGSLWPAIALHALYNAVPVALAFLATAG